MTFEVEVGENLRTVAVHRHGQVLHVEMGGRTHIVDARRVGDAMLSLLIASGEETSPVKSVDVALTAQGTPGAFRVHVSGRTVAVQVRQAGAVGRQKREGSDAHPSTRLGAGGAGPQRVVAPMPGKIVRVLVTAGEEVTARQGLVVVEAMKMENELRAVRDGRVREVTVSEGQSVDAGAVLMVVE